MKHSIRVAAAGLAAAVALTAAAGASSFDHCADALHDIGLFQGTSSGYQLDASATRAEAATMLVRLLGKESAAKTLQYQAPFTDLKGWEAPYVEYLYENGLTSGTGTTTFSPTQKCNAQMYATFLMRALGYSEAKGDFTYQNVLDKAKAIGLVDSADCSDTSFLRDNMAAMSYTALSLKPKSSASDTLLQQLVSEGAVDSAKASDLLSQFKLYSQYNAANEALMQDGRYAMSATMHADVYVSGVKTVTLDMPMDMKVMMNQSDPDASQMAMTGKINATATVNGQSTDIAQDISYYYTNGNYYMAAAGMKVKMPLSLQDYLQDAGSLTGNQPISLVKSMSTAGNVLHLEYAAGAIDSMVNRMLSAMQTEDTKSTSFQVGDLSADITMNGQSIQKCSASGTLSLQNEDQPVKVVFTEDASITATGSDVTITLPDDLSSYTDLSTLDDTE